MLLHCGTCILVLVPGFVLLLWMLHTPLEVGSAAHSWSRLRPHGLDFFPDANVLQQVPDSACTVADVARVVGEDKAIRPIHVGEQANIDQVRRCRPPSV